MSKNITAIGLSVVVCMFVYADDIKEVDIGEITTTATGFENYVKNVPATVSVITKEELERKPIRDVGDAVVDVPGVDVTYDKTGQGVISIRGFGSDYTLVLIDGKSQNPDSGFMRNGFGNSNSFIPPVSMIERIEVLKGPASTIYGSGAIGGVVNIITKKHPTKSTASLQLETTQQEERKIWGSSSGLSATFATPLVNEVLSVSFRAKYFDKLQNYIVHGRGGSNPYATHAPGAYLIKGVGSRVTYTPDSSNSFYVDGEFYDQTVDTLSTGNASVRVINKYSRTGAVVNHDGNYEFGKTNAYFQYSSLENQTGQKRASDKFVSDAKLNTPIDLDDKGFISLTTGFNHTYSYIKDPRRKYDQNQLALYAEADYTISEFVSVIGGGRYNYSSLFGNNFSPRFYTILHPDNSLTIKTGITAGYSIPSIQSLYPGDFTINPGRTGSIGNPNLKPEKSWNYELSSIANLDYGKFTTTGFFTYFQDRVENMDVKANQAGIAGIICVGGTNVCRQPYNVGDAIQYGAELEFQTRRYYGFMFNTGYTLTLSRILNTGGRELSQVPRHAFNTKLSYAYNNLDAYLRYQAKFKTPATFRGLSGVKYYNPFHLVDLGLGYKIRKDLSVNFMVNNLLNKNFLDFSHGTRTSYQYYQPGRNYWLSLKLDV